VMPGTYTENITTGLQNLTTESYLFEMGALINIAGTLTLTHTASSIRLIGITATNISHTGAGSLYMMRCRTNTNFATSGGYVEMTDCDTQGGANTGTLTISGTAGTVIIDGTTFLTPTNTNARINIAAGIIYQIVSAKYDEANSTINGTATVLNAIYYNISDPTISTEPATKNYVDTSTVKKDGTESG
jgi:hypothetical protein